MESGYRSFEENFQECCNQSLYRLAYEHQQTDADYFTRMEACNALYDVIREKLGDEQELIGKFDAAINYALAFDDGYLYQQGFQDCVTLLRWIGLL